MRSRSSNLGGFLAASTGLLTCAIGLISLAALPIAPALASVSCAQGAAPTSQLTVDPYEDPEIDLDFASAVLVRAGDRLLVSDGLDPVTCSGPTPTLTNTESVYFAQGGLSFATFSLERGLLAPGGSAEPDGSNEVEVQFAALRHSLAYSEIRGTKAVDRLLFGRLDGISGAVLSPQRPGEFDATYTGPGHQIIVATGHEGADVFRADGRGPLSRLTKTALFKGGSGADRLDGGSGRDILHGDAGGDRLHGFTGGDLLGGGRGHDRLDGGAGDDELKARDQTHDLVICGPGHDKAIAD
jgi:hypothetical protein